MEPPVPQSGHKSGYSRAKARIEQLATTNRHLKNRIRNMAEHIDALVTERDALQTRHNKLRRENEEALLFCERLVEERR